MSKTPLTILFIIVIIFIELILSGFSNPAFAKNQKPIQENKIKHFVLFNYPYLSNDIIKGDGLYVRTLFHLLGIGEHEQKEYQKQFLELLINNKRIPDFSNAVSTLKVKE